MSEYTPERLAPILMLAGNDVASPISVQWQALAQNFLESPRMVEASEGIFSTCQEPIESFGKRLLRARDTGVPLVEVSVHHEKAGADPNELREMLGIEGDVANRLRIATGQEVFDSRGQGELYFQSLGYVRHSAGSGRLTYGKYLTTVLDWGTFSGYPARPSFGTHTDYERNVPYVGSRRTEMSQFLITATELFEDASLRDGAIPGEVVPQQLQ